RRVRGRGLRIRRPEPRRPRARRSGGAAGAPPRRRVRDPRALQAFAVGDPRLPPRLRAGHSAGRGRAGLRRPASVSLSREQHGGIPHAARVRTSARRRGLRGRSRVGSDARHRVHRVRFQTARSDGMTSTPRKKIVIGITGASGAPYARRLVGLLRDRDDVELGVCISQTASEVWALECGGELRESIGVPVWGVRDYKAPFASGSAGWHAMAVVPCSMGTAARIAHGISDTLLTRAADVMIKERRSLLVVPRETPLSVVHLENLTALARAGAVVLPAMPSFYGKPATLDEALDTVIARVLDHLGLEHDLVRRWGAR